MRTIQERVRFGMQWLDRSGPSSWRSILKPDKMKFANPDYGPLGQLYGDYVSGLKALNIIGSAAQMGFRSEYRVMGDPAKLKLEWERVLKTHDKWHTLGNSLIRRIKGIQFILSDTPEGIKVSYFKSGQTIELSNLYGSFDSAKRKVRALTYTL